MYPSSSSELITSDFLEAPTVCCNLLFPLLYCIISLLFGCRSHPSLSHLLKTPNSCNFSGVLVLASLYSGFNIAENSDKLYSLIVTIRNYCNSVVSLTATSKQNKASGCLGLSYHDHITPAFCFLSSLPVCELIRLQLNSSRTKNTLLILHGYTL